MGRPRKWGSDAERIAYWNSRRSHARLASFQCVDGEGSGDGPDHRYVLLGVHGRDGGSSVSAYAGLGFDEICEFLYGKYLEYPGSVFAGFFLGYDFTHWLKLLPKEKAVRLFDPETRQRNPVTDKTTGELVPNPLGPWPVTYQGWEFDILGMRRFKLKPEKARGWMYICDAGSFFQQSLMSVLDPKEWKKPVVTDEEYRILEEGKRKRDTALLDSNMVEYNALENRVLSRVLAVLDTGFRAAGVALAKDEWFGPGQAAQAWLDNINAPTTEMVRHAVSRNRPDLDILGIARESYYGGWFEIFAHGHVPGNVWEYDINSAYPHVIRNLPCLLHGTWMDDNSEIDAQNSGDRNDSYRLVKASVLGSDPVCGSMLHRNPKHGILRPQHTSGWFWEHELAAGMRAGVVSDVRVSRGIRYLSCSCLPPLRGLAGLYDERLRVGKKTPQGKAYKLLYNSAYGKFAQTVGNPKYSNYIYASLITSGTRTMILDAVATHPGKTRALLMVATDGVYFSSRHPSLSVSPALGAWEECTKTNLTLFKPGVYWDDDTRERIRNDEDPRFKARGINAREFAKQLADIDAHYHGWTPGQIPAHPSVTFKTSFSMVTPLQALQRGKWETCGNVSGMEVTQNASPEDKRYPEVTYDRGIWRSKPYAVAPDGVETVPYPVKVQPADYDAYGINDDGTVMDTWRLR